MVFHRALVRKPSPAMINGLTTANLGKPDYERACIQHEKYIEALRICGLEVIILEPDNRFPDSVFIEDTALLTPACAILMNPGAESRRGEADTVKPVLKKFFDKIESIRAPGTAEGGDVMMVGSHFYIGLSSRTNQAGAKQLKDLLTKYHFTASIIPLKYVLHLKTGVAYLENNYLLTSGEFLKLEEFNRFERIEIVSSESYAANSIWINGHILMPAGFPKSKKAIEQTGIEIIEVDVSEFRKLDGGVSCLSLRF